MAVVAQPWSGQDEPGAWRRQQPPPRLVDAGLVAGGSSTRTVEVLNEDGTECISIGAAATTSTVEVVDMIADLCKLDSGSIRLVKRVGSYNVHQTMFEEVASRVAALGVKTFSRPIKKYDLPILVIGAGLGGMQTMITLKKRGRTDIICVEKLSDFGGHSWITVANKYTKLQTEKGTYYVDYLDPDEECPTSYTDVPYTTWPSRDQLLHMFRASARKHGLYDLTRFNTSVERVKALSGGRYALQTVPADDEDGGELLLGSAVMAWPGNLCMCNTIDFPGEDAFEGYIEYASFGKMDFTKVAGKEVILYGHGAFTIENVRTLLEHRCKKVFVLCRKRNLCGMKIASWLVAYSDQPVPGNIVMEVFQTMYDLVGFDVWSAHSVKTDANRSFAHVSQKTVFGVTDVYFLAGYYGLMEVVEDEIKRLTRHCAHTQRGRRIEAEVILKAVGTKPDFAMDKMLGLRELHGLWVNGDPMRPVVCNSMYVEARNFGSFSSGPGFIGMILTICWFIDYPGDWEAVKGQLPVNRAGDRPAYVPSTTHLNPTFALLSACLPSLAAAMTAADVMKTRKQRAAHPIREYLAACKAEWECYISTFKKWGMVDDRPEPPYPFTEGQIQDWLDRTGMYWMQRAAQYQQKQDAKVGTAAPTPAITAPPAKPPAAVEAAPVEAMTADRPIKQYDHPILVIGAGLGGMQTMIELQKRGRKNILCVERLGDFGGHSWISVANKYTKLQTEKGTYYVDYLDPDADCPSSFDEIPYSTWPSRDQLLHMFRASATKHGLYDLTRFNTSVDRVEVLPGGRYALHTAPVNKRHAGEVIVGSAVMAWPGNLCHCNTIEFEGEDAFEGYIEYASFGKMDFTRVAGKEVILYGHGAFTIENVRTLLEHECKKVHVLCRRRNLCGMKIASWLVAFSDQPVPGNIVMEVFQTMYDLVGFDVWSAHSVKTDAKRSFAHVSQKTVFGVTDVYFLAAYYGLMEVIEDEIKRLTRHCAHTKGGRRIDAEVILKAVGTKPDFAMDKMLGLTELHGLWVNGDPLRPVVCNSMYVEARNFGSFSSGPGFIGMILTICWFIDYPGDWVAVKGKLPVHRASATPAYVPATLHLNPTFALLSSQLPALAAATAAADAMKTRKQRAAHPMREYLADCKAEWECYIRVFKERGMIDDRPEPAYPFTEGKIQDWLDRTGAYWRQRAEQYQQKQDSRAAGRS